MALCVMVLIASEFMPVSLLTPIASDLRMTEGQAGQAISVSGVFAVVTSLVMAAAAARLDRRTVYLRPFLETVTRVDVATLSLMLLVVGVAGLVGTSLIGSMLTTRLYGVLIAIPAAMAVVAVALIAFGSQAWGTAALLAAWGLIATPAPVGWGTWLTRTLPEDAEAGGGLMVATIQFAITIGASLGGLVFDVSGYRSTFAVSAVVLTAAAFLAFKASRAADSAAFNVGTNIVMDASQTV